MSEGYKRPTIRGWLLSTVTGTFLSVYLVVTLATLFFSDAGLIFRGIGWLLGMVIGTAWAVGYLVVLIATDVALLAAKVRTLPTGGRGWLMALALPALLAAIYAFLPPHKLWTYGVWAVLAGYLIPILIAVIPARVVFGLRPIR